jgi:hypothetical protein
MTATKLQCRRLCNRNAAQYLRAKKNFVNSIKNCDEKFFQSKFFFKEVIDGAAMLATM